MNGRKKCDVVMQGGVTSGVVFPGLVCKLAVRYDFQSIGGTSAGAIAAALTAAAEYARRNGNASAFDAVADVPKWLGKDSTYGSGSNLFSLFQPQAEMKGLFKFAVAFLVTSRRKRIFSWLSLFWVEIIIGAIPGALLGYFAWCGSAWRLAIVLIATILACLAGMGVSAAVGLLLRLARLPRSFFGLCTGYAKPANKKPVALVPWLSDEINKIAGRSAAEPLTFGDLKRQNVTLRMMTTCLTWGRPFTLPFTTHEFYFSPEEFGKFFPEEIIEWMRAHPPKPRERGPDDVRECRKVDTTGLLPLPNGDDLPVIVAARLSLSFPFLFCAVPLYAVDYTLRECKEGETPPAPPVPGGPIAHGAPRRPEQVWFTDGGICNSFPLHLFDAPVPRWPTFGIRLTELRPDRLREGRVWMPTSNQGGIHPVWTRLSAKVGLSGTLALIFTIVNTARGWVNSLQAVVPGYRDRIVQIALSKREGGLNLSMPPETLADLNRYGCQAAERLIEHFIDGKDNGKPTRMTWDNQRWIRYRSTMSLLETFLADFAYALEKPEADDRTYSELITRGDHDPPDSYRFQQAQQNTAVNETKSLVDLGKAISGKELEEGTPKPEPALQIRPFF